MTLITKCPMMYTVHIGDSNHCHPLFIFTELNTTTSWIVLSTTNHLIILTILCLVSPLYSILMDNLEHSIWCNIWCNSCEKSHHDSSWWFIPAWLTHIRCYFTPTVSSNLSAYTVFLRNNEVIWWCHTFPDTESWIPRQTVSHRSYY